MRCTTQSRGLSIAPAACRASTWLNSCTSLENNFRKILVLWKPPYLSYNPRNIFWLYGLAGSGKRTVAHTVAKTLTLDGLYLACYFPARDGSESTPANKLFPTIARRLALLYPPYREALSNQLRDADSDAALNGEMAAGLRKQVTGLPGNDDFTGWVKFLQKLWDSQQEADHMEMLRTGRVPGQQKSQPQRPSFVQNLLPPPAQPVAQTPAPPADMMELDAVRMQNREAVREHRRANGLCFYCGKGRHLAMDCREKAANDARFGRPSQGYQNPYQQLAPAPQFAAPPRQQFQGYPHGAYQRLPSYELMCRKWWIWDATRFIGMEDDTEKRKADKNLRRGRKILARLRNHPTEHGEAR